MKKRKIELVMAMFLLAGAVILSKKAVEVQSTGSSERQVILVDAGHGGYC